MMYYLKVKTGNFEQMECLEHKFKTIHPGLNLKIQRILARKKKKNIGITGCDHLI